MPDGTYGSAHPEGNGVSPSPKEGAGPSPASATFWGTTSCSWRAATVSAETSSGATTG